VLVASDKGCRSGRTSGELVPESTRTGLSRTFNDMKKITKVAEIKGTP